MLGSLALLATVWISWQIYAAWGLVTLDEQNAPVGKVLDSISRQGGIEIASNLDPSTPVTIQVKRVPPVEALDIVAVRTEASWRLAYLGASDDAAIKAALADFCAGGEAPGWTSYGAGNFNFVAPQSGAALDLRRIKWNPPEPGGLPALLQDAADKTGVLMAAPSDWKASVSTLPAGKTIAESVSSLFRNAGGVSREVFLLRGREGPAEDEEPGDRRAVWIGSSNQAGSERGGGGWMRTLGDAQRNNERVEAQIALLPEEEQEKARDDFKMMSEFWQSVRDLPEEQRRAKAQEFFNRPEVAERMEDRRLARDAKRTPAQRIERSKRYWDRKAEAKYRGSGN